MKSSKNQNKASLTAEGENTLIGDLLGRGVQEIIEREHLVSVLNSGKKLRVKFGIDPTSSHIHLGRAIPLRKLRDFQRLGHKVVLIVGDFTAQIGDPSDKLSKRPMLSSEEIKENLKAYKDQLGKIIDLRRAEFLFNSKWLSKLGFQEISELAENFTVGQMLERRNFRERFDKHEEISLREFMYPLMQGYDSVATKADVEIGGADQLFNLMAGRVIQPRYKQAAQDIMTFEMLEGTDGRKMSSSWGNLIAIDDEPADMFGKVMSLRDELIVRYFELCTDVPKKEIEEIKQALSAGSINPRDAKIRLAKEIVTLYHSAPIAEKAEKEFNDLFRSDKLPSDVEEITVPFSSASALEILHSTDIYSSKGEARRQISQGAVKFDGEKVISPEKEMSIPEKGIILQAGKKKITKKIKTHS
jgi:tyrosyl-tRNA synthetase